MPEHVQEALVADHEILLRRLNLFAITPEGDGYRPNSEAFTNSDPADDGLSVDRLCLITEEELQALYPRDGIAKISVAQVRECGEFRVVENPLPAENGMPPDLAHALVKPPPKGNKAKRMADGAGQRPYSLPTGRDEVRSIAERLAAERGAKLTQVWTDAVKRYLDALEHESAD